MRYLCLSDNQIGQLGADAISRGAQVREKKGSRLQRVWMAGNKMDASQLTRCIVDMYFMYVYADCSAAISSYL